MQNTHDRVAPTPALVPAVAPVPVPVVVPQLSCGLSCGLQRPGILSARRPAAHGTGVRERAIRSARSSIQRGVDGGDTAGSARRSAVHGTDIRESSVALSPRASSAGDTDGEGMVSSARSLTAHGTAHDTDVRERVVQSARLSKAREVQSRDVVYL
jgi:hypothetical protein